MLQIDADKFSLFLVFTKSSSVASQLLGNIAQSMAQCKANSYSNADRQYITGLGDAVSYDIIVMEGDSIHFTDDLFFRCFWTYHIIDQYLSPYLDQPEVLLERLEEYVSQHRFRRKADGIEHYVLLLLSRFYGINVLAYVELQSGRDFWLLYQELCDIMHLLDTRSKDVANSLHIITSKTQGDGAAVWAGVAVGNLSANQPIIGYQLLSELNEEANQPIRYFVVNVLLGLAQTQEFSQIYSLASSYLLSADSTSKLLGIAVCSRFDYANHQDKLQQTIRQYDLLLQSSDEITILEAIVGGYSALLKQNPENAQRILVLSEREEPELQYQISTTLWLNVKEHYHEAWFDKALLDLSTVSTEHKGILERLGYCMGELLALKPLLVWQFLENWIVHHAHEEAPLSWFKRQLSGLQNHPVLFGEMITRWFNSNHSIFHIAAAYIVEQQNDLNGGMVLSEKVLQDLEYLDIKFITLKVLAYVISKEPLCTLTFSILRVAQQDERIVSLVMYAFTRYIAYNYPSVKDFMLIKEQTGTTIEKAVARDIIVFLDDYFDAKASLKHLKELEPPQSRVQAFAKARMKSFGGPSKGREQNQPSILSIMTKINLKAGKTFFCKAGGSYSNPSALGHYQVEAELPRGEFIDPIGQQKLRFQWRVYTRKQ